MDDYLINGEILTDIAELECDIDVARAKHAKERAEARLPQNASASGGSKADAPPPPGVGDFDANLSKNCVNSISFISFQIII